MISIKTFFRASCACLALACGTATAADPRIKEVYYDRDKVYSVFTAVGIANLIQFAPDESLQTSPQALFGMGDAGAWHVASKGNNVAIKPASKIESSLLATNMVLVTNKRTYTFDLRPASAANPPTYVMRFIYPEDQAAEIAAIREKIAAAEAARKVQQATPLNTNYTWKGRDADAALAPTAAWDDGRFTRLEYDHAGELPVFFKVLPDGTEALINYNIDPQNKEKIILQEVIRIVRARLNDQVIEIHNRSYKLPALNRANAGDAGSVRTDGEQW